MCFSISSALSWEVRSTHVRLSVKCSAMAENTARRLLKMACLVGPTVVFATDWVCLLRRYFISSVALFFLGNVYLVYTFAIAAKMVRRHEVPALLEGKMGLEPFQLVLRGYGRLSTTPNSCLTVLRMCLGFPFAMMSHGSHSHGATLLELIIPIHPRIWWSSAAVFWGCPSLAHFWCWMWVVPEEGLLFRGEPFPLDIWDGLSSLRRPCDLLLLLFDCLAPICSPQMPTR